MLSMILGYVYVILFESPIKIYCESSYINLVRGETYNIISTGIRFAPRILFACSGYCLAFKILSYFDKKMKIINEDNEKNNNNNPNEKTIDDQSFNIGEKMIADLNAIEYDNRKRNNSIFSGNNLPIKYLFTFIFKQFHKYLIYVFVLFFFKFSFFTLFSYLGQIGPMWLWFKNYIIDQFCNKYLIYQIFLLDNVFDFSDFDIYDKKFTYMFWIISCEIKFFLFSSFLLYLAYRRNNRLDIFIILLIPFVIIGKVSLYLLMRYYFKYDDFIPTIFYQNNLYGIISISPYFNYIYYLIGIFFGMINYIHQKSLRKTEILNSGKSFLLIPFYIYDNFIQYKSSKKTISKMIMFFLVMIGILLSFSLYIFIRIINVDTLKKFNSYFLNVWINCFYMVDIEIFVIILFIVCSGISKSEGNLFFNILNSNYWIFKNKIYFGYCLLMNSVISYIFYQSESRVKIEFFNVLFLSIVCYMNLFIVSSLFYIFTDAPFKKFNKFVMQGKKSN
jgi:hypothetical protein